MVRKRPRSKSYSYTLLTCVQTTEHIRTRSDRVFTVLLSSYKWSGSGLQQKLFLHLYHLHVFRPQTDMPQIRQRVYRVVQLAGGRNTTEAVFKRQRGIWDPMLELTYNLPVRYLIGRLRSPEAQFFVPNWGDKVHYRIRLSYRHYHTHTGSWLAYKMNRVTVPLRRTTRMLSLKKASWTKNSKNEYSPCNTSSPR